MVPTPSDMEKNACPSAANRLVGVSSATSLTPAAFVLRIVVFVVIDRFFGLVGCLALGCRIAPVVSDTQVGGSYYDDCEQAAQNYCEQVVKASSSELDTCVAKYAFQCMSGRAD